MTRVLCVMLGLAWSCAGLAAEVPLACKTSLVPPKYRKPVEDLATGSLPIPDYREVASSCRDAGPDGRPLVAPEPKPVSAWLESEKARYTTVLAKQPADILVVPLQIQGYGLDRIERAVMTADLAYAIGDAGALRVADPFFTALALGEGERRFDPAAVRLLAEKIGARKILYGYVGHDLKHTFTLTFELMETNGGRVVQTWRRDWRSVAFTNAKTPAYVLHDMLPAILKEMPLGLAPKPAAAVPAVALPARIDVPPADLVSRVSTPDTGIATASLLATLLPERAELARERLFVRAWLATMGSGSSRPTPRFLEAYALLNLHRRPVALARIEKAEGASFAALRALLNGDLPGARRETGRVKNPFEQLLLQISVRDLEYEYRVEEPAEITAAGSLFTQQTADAWMPLLLARAEDGNRWFIAEASWLKTALDRAFPLKEFELESLERGNSVVSHDVPDDVGIDLANMRHAHRIAATLDTRPCCRSRDPQPGKWNLLWLLEGAAQERMNRALEAMVFMQGRSDAALNAISRYEPVFKGQPMMTALGAAAAHEIAAESPDDVRKNWTDRGLRDGRAAIQWAPGQNRAAMAAAVSLGIPSPDSILWLDVYGYDFPRRAAWPFEFLGSGDPSAEAQRLAFVSEAYEFSTSEMEALSEIRGPARQAALASLGSRFMGNPRRPAVEPVPAMAATPEGRIAAARAAAKDDPMHYYVLGHLTFLSERPLKEALDAFRQYPPFRTGQARERVELSNNAYEVGSRFFWLGEAELAKPLFQISADLQTGSHSSMASEDRLLLLKGDYRGAAEGARRRAVRYSSSFAQRDYLSLLHAFGDHDAAWSAFSQLRGSQGDPALWTSALVGHRMQKLEDGALREWLRSPEIRNAKFKAQRFASLYAVLWYSTDRAVPPDLGSLVEELEGERVALVDSGGLIRPHPVDPSGFEFVVPTFRPQGAPASPPFPEGTRLKSERAYFGDAYAAVARGEHAKAAERFAEMSKWYPIDGAAMPYFAYAASKTGDAAKLESYVTAANPYDYENFDIMLSRAFFAAGRKQTDEAYRLLRLAFRAKPVGMQRPVNVDYQFAQACEWLYRDTKDARFAATLLEWATSYQSVQPVTAWAYTVQFQYERNPEARIRALAMAQYLDPLSDRIRGATAAEVAKAQAWLAKNNPFLSGRKPADPSGPARTAALH